MTTPGARAWIRPVHLAAAVVMGIPTALVGGYMAVMALVFGIGALMDARGPGTGMVLMLWGLAGLVGVIAWARLTLAYAMRDRIGLARCDSMWWFGVMAGIAAAGVLLYVLLSHSGQGQLNGLLLLLGPLLIPLALHLMWLRFGSASGSVSEALVSSD